MRKNHFRVIIKKFGISNSLAAKVLGLKPATIAHMKSDAYLARVSGKRLHDLAHRLLLAYTVYLQAQLAAATAMIDKIER